MEILLQKHGVCLKEQQTNIGIDLTENDTKIDYLVLTHLKEETLNLLTQINPTTPVYLSQDLYWLLQKLMRFNFITSFPLNCKILPYGCAVTLENVEITALNSDDGLYGAIALLIASAQQTLAYPGAFCLQGAHKKRLKNWKKILQASQPDYLILDQRLKNLAKPDLSEVNLQKAFLKFLNHQPLKPKIILSPWNPERIYRYHQTALGVGWKIIFNQNYAKFLHSLYPFDTFYVDFASSEEYFKQPATNEKIIVQTEINNSTTKVFIDPVIADFAQHPSLDAYLQTDLIGLGDVQLNEFITYLSPKKIYYCN